MMVGGTGLEPVTPSLSSGRSRRRFFVLLDLEPGAIRPPGNESEGLRQIAFRSATRSTLKFTRDGVGKATDPPSLLRPMSARTPPWERR